MKSADVLSPAKINLSLAITGRRADGYHDLVSVVAKVGLGDRLHVELTSGPGLALECSDPSLACDDSNLVRRAAQAFQRKTGWSAGVRIFLEKKIPMGAGLGGGSSNATATLRALNSLAGEPLDFFGLLELARGLGSDCALFLYDGPVIMRGRGEQVEPLPAATAARLSGRRVMIFKPSFGISTAWAYGQMAVAAPSCYLPAEAAEARLAGWRDHPSATAEMLLFNNMEPVAFRKFIALPALLALLRRDYGVAAGMSGSGSACFALLGPTTSPAPIATCIREAWGEDVFLEETILL